MTSDAWETRFNALVREMQAVPEDMGIYPAAVQGYGDERDYAQRDGFKNGWNAAVLEYGQALAKAADRAAQGISDDMQMLIAADVGWLRDGVLWLNMNDTWGWAEAGAEEVPADAVPEVARLFRKWGQAGLLYWVSQRNNGLKSEFHDINRHVEFVRHEEAFVVSVPDSSQRAYTKLSYQLGEEIAE